MIDTREPVGPLFWYGIRNCFIIEAIAVAVALILAWAFGWIGAAW